MIAKGLTSYSYKDYLKTNEDERIEIIDGMLYNMSPAPNRIHQKLSIELIYKIRSYLEGKTCEVYDAPFDVFLLYKDEDLNDCRNIVQPDILVVCDKSKLTIKGCVGIPDFIIEIVSPFSKSHDYIKKLNLYNDYGLPEYWIVNPMNETITVYLREDDSLAEPRMYTFKDKVPVRIFDDLVIDFMTINI